MAAHALLSASASHRWLNCPPSAKLCADKEDKGSEYAKQGTDAHTLCESKLLLKKSRQQLRRHTKKENPNLRVTAEVFLHSLPSRLICVTVTSKDWMMNLMQTAISSMQTLQRHRVSWMQTVSRFLITVRFIAVYTAERPSTFTRLIPTVIRVSPVVLTIFRRLRTENLLVASLVLKMTSLQMQMMIFSLKKGLGDNEWELYR